MLPFPPRIPRPASVSSRDPLRRLRRLFALALVVATLPSSAIAAPSQDVDRRKASFIYRLAQFVTWPESASAARNAPMQFCVLARPSFAETLGEVIRRRSVHSRQLRALHVESLDEIDGCDLLYVGAEQMASFDEVSGELADRPVLTIGEVEDFVSRGGMINFIRLDRKLLFEVNRTAIESSGLRPASQLLRLASEIHAEDPEGQDR